MSEPFIAEVRMFGLTFAPRGWAFCDGQLLPIAQNTALFSIVGTTYGGDGRTTFGLPNLQQRMPMHPGRGPGLTPRSLGQQVGTSQVTLTQQQIPAHNHVVSGNKGLADHPEPNDQELARGHEIYDTELGKAPVLMAPQTVPSAGGGQAHENQSPYLNITFVIALQGLFPSRS